ncbi:MAG: hypothetical protein RL098_1351 [Bacteroidota bacterium]
MRRTACLDQIGPTKKTMRFLENVTTPITTVTTTL